MAQKREAEDRVCRVCGCTEDRACITRDGACSWVKPDLCSACAEKEGEEPEPIYA